MRMRYSIALLLVCVAPASAQQVQRGLREAQVRTWEADRAIALAMVDSMPMRLLRYKPTPEVRDFAQQIEHAAFDQVFFVSRFILANNPPALGDSAVYLNDKAALKDYVNAAFDYGIKYIKELPDSILLQPVRVFGNAVPKWQVFDLAHTHCIWTLGSVVPYFRLNGMAPPGFRMF